MSVPDKLSARSESLTIVLGFPRPRFKSHGAVRSRRPNLIESGENNYEQSSRMDKLTDV